jgi:beta-xylosidase
VLCALAGCAEAQHATFRNPVYPTDFPDPFVLRVGDGYVAYGTNGVSDNVRTLRSRDLVHWHTGKDAMPELGPWALRGWTWAPSVLRRDDGVYVLYYTARSFDLGLQCVGRAVARAATGPFVDTSRKPLVCQAQLGGSIDPDVHRDDSGLYLYWKNDGNCCGLPTAIYGQRLAAGGLSLTGRRALLTRNTAAWEGTTIEAPTMWLEDGTYVLFYSGNAYNTSAYAVGYATCRGPLGPCTDAAENPIVATACRAIGPGHQAVVRDAHGRTWLLYHAWAPGMVGSVVPGRSLWLDRLDWVDGKPVVRGPSCVAQPAP